MGTHPIFESDFDCLTEIKKKMDDPECFLDSASWRSRLKRTLLYPGNQSIDNTLPLQVSELCVASFRHAAPKKEAKLGMRVATRLTRNSCLSPSVVMMAL